MSTFPSPSNAIVFAQFNMQGRWRRLLSIAIGYLILIGALIWLTYVTSDQDLTGWVAGLCMLQVLNLLIFGSFRVDSAVRGDVSSRMLESHRLMPATPLGGILGYIFGAPLQTYLIAMVNFALGAMCCSVSHLSLQSWAMFNGIVLLFAIFVYSILAQFAFIARGGFLLLLIVGAITLAMSANGGLLMLPSIAVLIDPLSARDSIMEVLMTRSGKTVELTAYCASFAGQIAIILISIRAGIRRYQSSTIAGISALLGLMLLVVWVGLTLVFFNWHGLFSFRRSMYAPEADLAPILWMSFATSSLLALVPIGSAAWSAQLARRSGDPSRSWRRFTLEELITTVAAVVIISSLLTEASRVVSYVSNVPAVAALRNAGWTQTSNSPVVLTAQSVSVGTCVHTVVIVAVFLGSMTCLFSWGYLIRQRAWIFVLIWVLLTWLGPVITDAIYRSATNDTSRHPTIILGFSPAGALSLIWTEPTVSAMPGIIGQLVLAVVPTAVLLLTQERHRRRVEQAAITAAAAGV